MEAISEALAIAGIGLGVILSFVGVWYILQVIAMWKIFNKAGESGWKSIIPFFNDYTLFKLSWNKSMGLAWLLSTVVGGICTNIGYNFAEGAISIPVLYYIGEVLVFVAAVLLFVRCFKESKAFGHGIGFGIGLLLLNPIFNLILGFSQDKYVGAQK